MFAKVKGFTLQSPPVGPEHYQVLWQRETNGLIRAAILPDASHAIGFCLSLRREGYEYKQGFWRKK